MQKFLSKNYPSIVTSKRFESELHQAVKMAYDENNWIRDRYQPSFLGLVITFNPKSSNLELFSWKSHRKFDELLSNITSQDEYSSNELVYVIESGKIPLNSPYGYMSDEKRDKLDMTLENLYKDIYIELLQKLF